MRVRSFVPLALTATLLVVHGLAQALDLRVNLTASMPRGLYRVVADGDAAVGDVVAVCLPANVAELGRDRGYLGVGGCDGGVEAVVKAVAAVGGQAVELSREGVRVDGWLLVGSRPLDGDRAGRAVHPWLGRAVLADDELWLHSSASARGWDSRYFGPVPRSAVVAVVEPLWTFEGRRR